MFTPTSLVFGNAAIVGVQVIASWADLEPNPGRFNWAPLDQVFTQADVSGKFVVLTLVPGFGTPAWALHDRVDAVCFDRQYGDDAHQPAPLPLPWDATYLNRWHAFLTAVKARYGTNPEFKMISAAGPTSVSAEMSLPNATGRTNDKDKALPPVDRGSDIAAWEALGYTPERYEAAWQAAFAIYAHVFKRQYISLALYPGLPIANPGEHEADAERAETPKTILADGIADTKAGSFVVQANGLTASGHGGNVFTLVKSSDAAVARGFQLTTSATANPTVEAGPGGFPNPTNSLDVLTSALDRGVRAHADFLEVYEPDVVNPTMQCELQVAEAHWTAGTTPACVPPKPHAPARSSSRP